MSDNCTGIPCKYTIWYMTVCLLYCFSPHVISTSTLSFFSFLRLLHYTFN